MRLLIQLSIIGTATVMALMLGVNSNAVYTLCVYAVVAALLAAIKEITK